MKKHWIIILGIGALLIIGYGYRATRPAGSVYDTSRVSLGAVTHVVSVTGHVEPVSRITLAFSQGGRISHLAVTEGQEVTKGVLVASLERYDLEEAVREAQARVNLEHATLKKITAPLTEEEQVVQETVVAQAQQAEQNTVNGLRTVFARAFSVADDAVQEKADALFSARANNIPVFGIRFSYGTTDYFVRGTNEEEAALNETRAQVESALTRLKTRATEVAIVAHPRESAQEVEDDLALIDAFLTQLAGVVNDYTPTDSTAQTVYEGFQSSLTSARSTVSVIRNEVRSARAAYDTAVVTRELAEREYARAISPVTTEIRGVQEAALTLAEHSLVRTQVIADNALLYAPRTGTVARVVPNVGETVGAYSPVIELLTVGAYEVEAYIPEADIARIKIGDQAQITFDAFSRADIFTARVMRIALTETVREGVPTYKTTLILEDNLPEGLNLRPGMTANIDITTDVREAVLSIPRRSVTLDGDRSFVRVLLPDGSVDERTVVTGLRGSNGEVEVLQGLSEGEAVVVSVTS